MNIFFMKKFVLILFMFLGTSIISAESRYEVSKMDAELFRLRFLMVIKANCTIDSDTKEFKEPLCRTMQLVAGQLQMLIDNGQITLAEFLIPIITALVEENNRIKNATRNSGVVLSVKKDTQQDDELYRLMKELEEKIKNPNTTPKELESLLKVINQRIKTQKKN